VSRHRSIGPRRVKEAADGVGIYRYQYEGSSEHIGDSGRAARKDPASAPRRDRPDLRPARGRVHACARKPDGVKKTLIAPTPPVAKSV